MVEVLTPEGGFSISEKELARGAVSGDQIGFPSNVGGSRSRSRRGTTTREPRNIIQERREAAAAEARRKAEIERKRIEAERQARELAEQQAREQAARAERVREITARRERGERTTPAELVFLQSERARDIRTTAVSEGRKLDTPVRERQFIKEFESREVVAKDEPKEKEIVLEQRQVDTFRGVPVFRVVAIEDGRERKATLSEEKQFREAGRPLVITEPPSRLETLREKSFRETAKGFTTVKGTAGGLIAGFGTSFILTAKFAKELATSPVATTKATVQALTPTNLAKAAAVAGATIESEPAFATGFVAGEVTQFKGIGLAQKGALKVTDVVRTRRLAELKATEVVAKEFPRQTFPQIRRGETAGELLREFRPKLPGETRPAGFTAAPEPIKELVTRRGTSEVPGLFQAPEVSPRFLRLDAGERKLFGLNILGETVRPSVFRITPTRFRLPPGVKESTRTIQPQKLPEIRRFFETAPKGESIVPFIKTEKEAVIPFGTTLVPKGKRFFFRFEGRRIPIFEFETTAEAGKATRAASKLPTIEDIGRSISSSRVGRRSLISPSESVLISSRARSRPRTISSSPRVLERASRTPTPYRSRRGISSLLSIPKISRAISSGISRPSTTRISRISEPPVIKIPTTPGAPAVGDLPFRSRRDTKKRVEAFQKSDIGAAETFAERQFLQEPKAVKELLS